MSKEKNPEFTCIMCKKHFLLIGTHQIDRKTRLWCPYCGTILVPIKPKKETY